MISDDDEATVEFQSLFSSIQPEKKKANRKLILHAYRSFYSCLTMHYKCYFLIKDVGQYVGIGNNSAWK